MKKSFFNKFQKQGRVINRPLALQEDDWQIIDAYRLYGAAKAGYEIPLKALLREVIFSHIDSDRGFKKDEEKWKSHMEKSASSESQS